MGNKQSSKKSYENGKNLLSADDTEFGIMVQVIDMNHNHTEHIKYVETKQSKVGTFTYFKLSTNLTKIINNDVGFNINIYKKGTNRDKCVSIDRNYRLIENSKYYKKENVINKTRYYDYSPYECKQLILRHDTKMNLVEIIVFGVHIPN